MKLFHWSVYVLSVTMGCRFTGCLLPGGALIWINCWDSLFGPWITPRSVSSFISGPGLSARSHCNGSMHSMLKSRLFFTGPDTSGISSCVKLFTHIVLIYSELLELESKDKQKFTNIVWGDKIHQSDLQYPEEILTS